MKVRNKERGFQIQITGKKGKPVICRGFAMLEGGDNYKHCQTISEEVLYSEFDGEGK